MSLIRAKIEEPTAQAIRQKVAQLLEGVVPIGRAEVLLPDNLEFSVARRSDHLRIDWNPPLELEAPGPDPDMLRAHVYSDHLVIDLRISSLRLDY